LFNVVNYIYPNNNNLKFFYTFVFKNIKNHQNRMMLESIEHFLSLYNQYIGGYLLLILLIPTGIYYIIRLKFINFRYFGHAIDIIRGKFDDQGHGEISHFKALTMEISGTVGTGNIVGVSLAIYYGGPGAVFWMWITGFLGMVLKYGECMLSLKFRKVNADGSISGGPMYYIEHGLKQYFGKGSKALAILFAVATILAAIGTGNIAQANSIADTLNTNYHIAPWISGLILSIFIFIVIAGGVQRIAKVTSSMVPLMTGLYVAASMLVIIIFYKKIPEVFYLIISNAFTGTAATGGFIGSSMLLAMRYGVTRGIFSNEAGQGSAPFAYAAAKTNYPAREGMVSMIGPFVDTIVICTMTAFVVIVSGAWNSGIKGIGMTLLGFETGLNKIHLGAISSHIVGISLFLFALSTIISWSYYGTKATEYLFGRKAIIYYLSIYSIFVFLGSVWSIDLVWHFVDAVLSVMALPNLIAIILLFPIVLKETNAYLAMIKDKS